MKRFFEEYGGIALAILVVLVLIAILSPVGGKIKGSLKEVTKGFDDKMKNGMNSSGIGFGGSSDGGGTTENPTTPTETLEAGKKIEIEGKEYTVIECNGTQCKVLANELANDGKRITFDENPSNNYANSTIANYLDGKYYDNLPEKIQKAIVPISFQQKVASDVSNNNPTWTDETKDAGTHKVFVPSWDEVTKIYGTTEEGLKAYAPNGWTWLRDTFSSYVLGVNGNGNLGGIPPILINYVRPAFVLDLSKVEYTTK